MCWRVFLSVVWLHGMVAVVTFPPRAYGGDPDQVFAWDEMRQALPQDADEAKQKVHREWCDLLNKIEVIIRRQPEHEKRRQEVQAFAREVSANYRRGAEEGEEALKGRLIADDNNPLPTLSDEDRAKKSEEIDKMQKPADDLGAIVDHMDPYEESMHAMYVSLWAEVDGFVKNYPEISIMHKLAEEPECVKGAQDEEAFGKYMKALLAGVNSYLVGEKD